MIKRKINSFILRVHHATNCRYSSRNEGHGFKGHGGFDQLVWHEDWPVPQPKSGEVPIRVKACGLNNTDINTRTSWYSKSVKDGITEQGGADGFADAANESDSWSSNPIQFPRIQGADVTGEIVAIGADVSSSRLGERIIVDPWIFKTAHWRTLDSAIYFGSECDGGFAEYTTIPQENAIAISSSLTDLELATFSCALTTAENLVMKTHLKPGETVVIAGASGGVGSRPNSAVIAALMSSLLPARQNMTLTAALVRMTSLTATPRI